VRNSHPLKFCFREIAARTICHSLVFLFFASISQAEDSPPKYCAASDQQLIGDVCIQIDRRHRFLLADAPDKRREPVKFATFVSNLDHAIAKSSTPVHIATTQNNTKVEIQTDETGSGQQQRDADTSQIQLNLESVLKDFKTNQGIAPFDSTASLVALPDYFVVRAIPPSWRNDSNTRVIVHVSDGTTHELLLNPWLYKDAEPSLVQLTVEEQALEPNGDKLNCGRNIIAFPGHAVSSTPSTTCIYSFVIVRAGEVSAPDVIVGFEEVANGLKVRPELWKIIDRTAADPVDEFAVNGVTLIGRTTANTSPTPLKHDFFVPAASDGWRVEKSAVDAHECRRYVAHGKTVAVDIPHPKARSNLEVANGITVGDAKIFDVLALRKMLNDTATQLNAVAGFSSAPILAALTNIQGISRDTSYVSGQIAALPTASTIASLANTTGGTNTTTTTSPGNTTTGSSITLQCPDGTAPTIGSGNAQGCAVVQTGSGYSPVQGALGTLTTTGSTSATPTTLQVNGTTTGQQSGTTVTTPSISGTSFIPASIPSSALAVQNTVGASSSDLLTDQVQLNAQMTTLKLLLQGALSDQYVVRNAKAVATRQQTTLGFTISLDPPRQYRHAVAEVRVVVSAPPGQDPVSIMNLLPAEKTYNVAKVTSNAKAFGAGVVTSAIGVGINAGRSRDRLYLVKDTDTLALQYPPPNSRGISRPFPIAASDAFHSVLDFEHRGTCDDDDTVGLPSPGKIEEGEHTSIVFGWQFRPVLGADYVKGGQRQVFVQLALPAGLDQQYVPSVHIQTRWRSYDPKKQVVGAVYTRTCSWSEGSSGMVLLSRPNVRDVHVADLGGGQLKLSANGDFFSSGVTLLAGSTSYSPQSFDGDQIQVVGRAVDFMGADELSLVGANGQMSRFGIPVNLENESECGIKTANLVATPFPDGNSRMLLTMKMGSRYFYKPPSRDGDGKPAPLVLIGGAVYGLRETPFSVPANEKSLRDDELCESEENGDSTVCKYAFIAPTTDIRNAQTFVVKDVAWSNAKYVGKIRFLPSFSDVAKATWAQTLKPAEKKTKVKTPPAVPAPPAPAVPPTEEPPANDAGSDPGLIYTVKGFNLGGLTQCPKIQGRKPRPQNPKSGTDIEQLCVTMAPAGMLEVVSDTSATLTLPSSYTGITGVQLRLSSLTDATSDKTSWERRVVWDLPIAKTDEPKAVGTLQAHVGDSGQVSFTGTDKNLPAVKSIIFDGVPLAGPEPVYDPKKKTLTVYLTTQVTRRAGHKDLLGIVPGSKVPVQLPIDVL
jgi:hypothetical protein